MGWGFFAAVLEPQLLCERLPSFPPNSSFTIFPTKLFERRQIRIVNIKAVSLDREVTISKFKIVNLST